MALSLCVVTATTNPDRALQCLRSWGDVAQTLVFNSPNVFEVEMRLPRHAHVLVARSYLGTVPAFALGVEHALNEGADIIACLHDDLEIQDPQWWDKVAHHFDAHPACGLLGFGGATGLGHPDIYKIPYDPMQLARSGFRSNLVDAESHGVRSLVAEQVVCLDGFSQIGRADFWRGWPWPKAGGVDLSLNLLQALQENGMVHHAYDSALGVYAARLGWQVWYLPIRCHHYGGRTAVGDAGYAQWAASQVANGDQGFWAEAHRIFYDLGRGILPLRVGG